MKPTPHSPLRPLVGSLQFAPSNRLVSRRSLGLMIVTVFVATSFYLTHIDLSGTVLDHHSFPSEFQMADKLYHFGVYGMLTFLTLSFFTEPVITKSNQLRVASTEKILLWGALVLSYGVFDEMTQPFFGRRCDVYDLLANLVGISFAQLAFVCLFKVEKNV